MTFHLAQCNIVKLRAPLDSPDVTGFVAALDPINDQILLNMSVWESMEALKLFVYRSGHKEVLRRRREWADRFAGVQSTMWWLRAGCLPEPTDAVARLEALQRLGPTQYAFTFQSPFDAPAEVESN
ncbi:MAG: DUF3291 domain-containing protein [Acidimicrobiales bacterium]|jgi:hypothetical protein